ncbi:MAG TPA: FAD-dependent oxidoreductase [Waterburya sp.]|jgi:glycine/D-amino acid oxidase-like deaminating enzyme
MSHVVIIGCGVVGAAIAYELSQVSGLEITVFDRQNPAQGSTGAALGVLMGAISKKKGRAWQLRQTSMQRYETLIPELEALTGRQIPFNRTGIVMLRFAGEDLASWEKLVKTRQSQGWQLEIWDTQDVQSHCPQVLNDNMVGAIYSPQDRQVDPMALTQALVAAAEINGVTFRFGVTVEGVKAKVLDECDRRICSQLDTNTESLDIDYVVVAAGLGSLPITASLKQPVEIKPVLGQALHLRLERPLGCPHFQPVITGNDVHIVPVGERDYWVGATVEFPDQTGAVIAEPTLLETVRQEAIAFCPALAEATILRTWSGKRPRPEGRPAPIIGQLPGYSNVLLATGHYRNGVLLAPATAQAIREQLLVATS